MTRFARGPIILALVFTMAAPAAAQRREEHEVETLTSSEVGPYRPEFKPDLDQAAQQIVERTNRFRKEQKLPALAVNAELRKTAQYFADFMAENDRYGHEADGRQPSQRARKRGYDYCIVLENIAYQFRTRGFQTAELAERLTTGWKESPGHRENMLDAAVTQTGVAIGQSPSTGVFYAVQMFGRPKSKALRFRIENRTASEVHYRLGEKRYSLPARYIRKHTRCRPGTLTLLKKDGEKWKNLQSTPINSGEAYAVTPNDAGGITLKKRPPDEK